MGIASLVDVVRAASGSMMRKTLDTFSLLETGSGKVLIGKDGSVATMIRVDGCKQIMGEKELSEVVEHMSDRLTSFMSKPGHAMQVWFSRDPDLSEHVVQNLMRTPRSIASRLSLELDDLFEGRSQHLPDYLVWEGFYIVLWTRLSLLNKQEQERAKISRKPPPLWPAMADAQNLTGVVSTLMERHKAFVSQFHSDLRDVGLRARVLSAHDAIVASRYSVYNEGIGSEWRPRLAGDPIPTRKAEVSESDASHVFWPRLDDQIFSKPAARIDTTVAQIGDRLFGAADMTIGPQEILPFSVLIRRLSENDEFPWRVSFLIEGDVGSLLSVKAFFASVFSITNSENKMIKQAVDAVRSLQIEGTTFARMRASFATWAPLSDEELMRKRVNDLKVAVESWGTCEASMLSGDPVAAVMSSSLGLAPMSTAVPGVMPLQSIVRMLPWNRDASPWDDGAVLFRTPDGRPWPYQPGSSLQDTFIDLVCAPPGKGKSVLLNTTNFGVCLSPNATIGSGGVQLPRIAILDIGPSSSGLISLLKEALPPDRQHEVAYERLRMIPEHAINPFDTQLGCRTPLPLERSFLVNFLTALGTPVGDTRPPNSLPEIAGVAIDEVYKLLDDRNPKGHPRVYVPGDDRKVDNAVASYNLPIEDDTTWWDIVDRLFERGAVYEAMLAQRYAVPRLEDLGSIIATPQVTDIYGQAKTDNGEPVISVFQRLVSSSLRDYKILSMPTRFDVSAARVVSLDLDEVAPRGGGASDRQTAIMYMLARFVLARDFYLNEEIVTLMPEDYRDYHQRRIQRIRETPKRLVYDEFHRTKSAASVRDQVIIDIREGRKWNVQVTLASQLFEDFDSNMVDMATGIWILGLSNEASIDGVAQVFNLSDTAKQIIRRDVRGPTPKGAPFFVVLNMKDGQHEHLLYNTLSGVEAWAFSTTAEDAQIRNRLYSKLGAIEARRRLAIRFPLGSAKKEVERRLKASIDRGEGLNEALGGVIGELVEEIAAMRYAHEEVKPAAPVKRGAR